MFERVIAGRLAIAVSHEKTNDAPVVAVCPGTKGEVDLQLPTASKTVPIVAVQKAAARIVKEAEVEFIPHGLRCTAASCMTSMGIFRPVVSKVSNHVESGIAAIYVVRIA